MAEEEKTPDVELITRLLAQQAELAQEAQRQGQLREERLAALVERVLAGPPAAAGTAGAAAGTATGTAAGAAAAAAPGTVATTDATVDAVDVVAAAASAAVPADVRPATSSGAAPRLPASATPAPRLSPSASLKEFESWRQKFSGYVLLTGVSKLPAAEQRAALLALLDDDWTRVVRYGLPVAQDADVNAIITAMQAHLRRQRNVIIHRSP